MLLITDNSINPFAPAAKTEVFKTGMNPALATFPALLPTIPLMAPDVLVLSCRQPQPGRPSVRLLTGTFPLAQAMPVPPPSISLALAQRTDALERFLDVILRGVNACEMTFRESEKQTMIWREELEECGQQQDSEWDSADRQLTPSDGGRCPRRPLPLPHGRPMWLGG